MKLKEIQLSIVFFVIFRYGSPKIAHKISSFTIEAMLYLYDNEFTEGEKDFKLGALVSIYFSKNTFFPQNSTKGEKTQDKFHFFLLQNE